MHKTAQLFCGLECYFILTESVRITSLHQPGQPSPPIFPYIMQARTQEFWRREGRGVRNLPAGLPFHLCLNKPIQESDNYANDTGTL